MIEKHCVDCGTESRPKQYHPSSLRTELIVWLVALIVGAGVGVASVLNAPTSTPDGGLQRIALSAVTPADAADGNVTESAGGSSGFGGVAAWVLWGRDMALGFLATAWWVLPLPILFSLWRQFDTREGCVACRSRTLLAVEPPVFH